MARVAVFNNTTVASFAFATKAISTGAGGTV
jgi:hypothetical protein